MGARPDSWMPLYWGDYLRDTMHLRAEGHGAYLLLIGAYWTSGEPLPDDDEHLAAVARLDMKAWKRLRATLARFFTVEGGLWRHDRIDAEIAKATSVSEARRAAGKRGGKASGKTRARAEANDEANAKQKATQPQPHRERRETLDRDAHDDGSPSGIPLDEWGPSDEVRAWAAAETPGLDVCAEAATFRDHAKAEGRAIHDPDAAFRVWLRRGKDHRAKCDEQVPAMPGTLLDRTLPADPSALDDRAWGRLLDTYREHGHWNPRYGPKPGEKGCRVPERLMAEGAAA